MNFCAIQILALAVCAVSAFPQGRDAVDEVAVEPEAKSTTTPVPIIKQINKVNDDGSYTFGYEAGDGSFRIEKKELNGYVKGIRPNSTITTTAAFVGCFILHTFVPSTEINSFFRIFSSIRKVRLRRRIWRSPSPR